MGGHGVIRFLANYSRVPLTSPICLDYPDGSGEPRDLKRPRRPLSFFSLPARPTRAHPRPLVDDFRSCEETGQTAIKLIFVRRNTDDRGRDEEGRRGGVGGG